LILIIDISFYGNINFIEKAPILEFYKERAVLLGADRKTSLIQGILKNENSERVLLGFSWGKILCGLPDWPGSSVNARKSKNISSDGG